MNQKWDQVVCVSRDAQEQLVRGYTFFRRLGMYSGGLNAALILTICALVGYGSLVSGQLADTRRELQSLRINYDRSSLALSALARSHEDVLDAREQINTVGEKSWGRQFLVTKYVPSAGGINADSDPKHTATMWKADPKLRIIAVDPTLIPINSYIWVEGLGWYNAQDVGGGIKGFRLDVMEKNLQEAKKWGKQKKFAIVIPPSSAEKLDDFGLSNMPARKNSHASGGVFASVDKP